MAMTRMRWSNTGANAIGPRDGATLRSPVSDGALPRRSATHVHVHLPGRTRDQAAQATGGLPEARMDQNVEPPEAGYRDRGIRLRGHDQEGRNWSATIYGPGGAGYAAEEHDPDALTTSADAKSGGPGEHQAGQAFEMRWRRRSPRQIAPMTATRPVFAACSGSWISTTPGARDAARPPWPIRHATTTTGSAEFPFARSPEIDFKAC